MDQASHSARPDGHLAGSSATPTNLRAASRQRLRFALVHLLQLPSIALVVLSDQPASWWCAAVLASLICCAGTDSGWRWRNRLLVVEAIAWLVLAACFG